MGQRGPAPTPSGILKLRGSRKLENRKLEPKPDQRSPIRPAWLKGEARKAWESLVPQLKKMGVLTRIDRNALARYCDMWRRWRELCEFIDINGTTLPLKKRDGTIYDIKQLPHAKQETQLRDQLLRLEKEFGLTPSARARMTSDIEQPSKVDELRAKYGVRNAG